MAEKKIGEKKGKRKAATKKVIKKAKKAPSERKTTKPAKKKATKKTAEKVAKKIKARTKKIVKKAKVKAKVRKEKVTREFKGKNEVKREKKAEKRVAVKGKKTPPKLEEKVRVKAKVKAKVKAEEVSVPKKAVPRRAKKVVPAAQPIPIEVLPEEYGEDSVALMTVDPRKLFIYWEIKGDTLARYAGIINVRIYDVTNIDFDGTNANSYLDIPVHARIGNWYIDVSPEREYIVDIGIIDPLGVFITAARSNKVSTPRIEIAEEGSLHHRLYETDLPVGY